MRKYHQVIAFVCLCFFASLNGANGELYDGVCFFKGYDKIDIECLPQLLPYNPVIFDAGAFQGKDTVRCAKLWPKSTIVAFEPNPIAFEQMQNLIREKNVSNIKTCNLALSNKKGMANFYICRGASGRDPSYESMSSLLQPAKQTESQLQGPIIRVPCVRLDEWCQENNIDHIDVLRLELEGMELQTLQSCQNILKNVKVVYIQTFFYPYRIGNTMYPSLKQFLEKSGFVLLSHWYKEGERGKAIFLSRELFDAFFKLCLGVDLGV